MTTLTMLLELKKEILKFLAMSFSYSPFLLKLLIMTNYIGPVIWSRGNALVSGTGGLRFKSQAGQIGHSVYQRLATTATVVQKELSCPQEQ